MNRRSVARTAIILSAAALSACVVNLAFEMKKTFPVKSQAGAPNSISQSQVVNLADYKEVTDHQANIKSLDLDYAEATVTTVNTGNHATKVSGTLKLSLSPTGNADADILVGTLTNFPVNTVGSTVKLNGTPALDAFLLEQLHKTGTFYAIITGTVDGSADVVLDVNLHAAMGYDSGLF